MPTFNNDRHPSDPADGVVRFSFPLDLYLIGYGLILILSLAARLYRLDERPLHHDESMIAAFSWNLYSGKGYQYLPLLHGPLLFYLNAVIFFLFGVSDTTFRLGQAMIGVGLVGLLHGLRAYFSRPAFLAAAFFIGLGPTFLYFTRFGKHDPFLIFLAIALVLFAQSRHLRGTRSGLFGVFACLALLLCTKENSILYIGIFAGFLGLLALHPFFTKPGSGPVLRDRLRLSIQALCRDWRSWALGFVLFAGIFVLFYSSFLTHWKGVVDGALLPLTSSLGAHQQPGGWESSFTYYLPLLLIYETPVAILVLLGLYHQLGRSATARILFLGSFAVACACAFFLNASFRPGSVPGVYIDRWSHVAVALFILLIGSWSILSYLREGRVFRGFLVHWSTFSFLAYSAFSVKAPWLSIHVVAPMILLGAAFFGDFWESAFRIRHRRLSLAPVLLIGVLTLHNTILLNYYNASDPKERMVTAQTDPGYIRLLNLIDEVAFRTGRGYDTPIAVQEIAAWPMGWYLREYRNWYHPGPIEEKDRDKAIIIGDINDRDRLGKILLPDYVEFQFPHKSWSIPDTKDLTLSKAWRYFMYREPIHSIVRSHLAVYVRRELLPYSTPTGRI